MGDEYLTMAEIYAKYPNEWLVIDRLRRHWWSGELLGGRVFLHSGDHDEFRRMVDGSPDWTGVATFRYTGPRDPEAEAYMRSVWVEE